MPRHTLWWKTREKWRFFFLVKIRAPPRQNVLGVRAILKPFSSHPLLRDSKILTENQRLKEVIENLSKKDTTLKAEDFRTNTDITDEKAELIELIVEMDSLYEEAIVSQSKSNKIKTLFNLGVLSELGLVDVRDTMNGDLYSENHKD